VYASHPEFEGLPQERIQNRALLKGMMAKHGFLVDPMEWWYFNYKSATVFEIVDIPLLQLLQIANGQKP
jgi:D-alanyl-D-alanine dipeptidase